MLWQISACFLNVYQEASTTNPVVSMAGEVPSCQGVGYNSDSTKHKQLQKTFVTFIYLDCLLSLEAHVNVQILSDTPRGSNRVTATLPIRVYANLRTQFMHSSVWLQGQLRANSSGWHMCSQVWNYAALNTFHTGMLRLAFQFVQSSSANLLHKLGNF